MSLGVNGIELRTAASESLDEDVREVLRELWRAAFGDFAPEDEEHAWGGLHVLALDAGRVVSHACVVPRTLLVDGEEYAAGYVEAVATLPSRQGQGLGTEVMRLLDSRLAERYELGALSTGVHEFYEQLGWERWRGPSYVLRQVGEEAVLDRTEEEDDGLMVLRTSHSSGLDLTAAIVCHERPGDDW
jgi:aminoglycoside 2'-N-acetyltransferase I